MAGRRRYPEEGQGPNEAGWLADFDEIETDLADLDDDIAAELRSAMEDFYLEYYPFGLLGRDLDRHRRELNLRRRWRVDEAEAARPTRVWEFRPEQGSNYRVLFGEDPATLRVFFLGIVVKSQGARRQTSAMRRAANRLSHRLGRSR